MGAEKDLVEGLERDIVQENPNVRWYVLSKTISVTIETIEWLTTSAGQYSQSGSP